MVAFIQPKVQRSIAVRWGLWLLCICAAILIQPGASARTIENIAHARWTQAGTAGEVTSNRVAIEVAIESVRMETFRAGSDGAAITYSPSLCGAGGGTDGNSQPSSVQQSASLSPTAQYRVGEVIIFEIIAPIANRDSGAIDTLTVRVTSERGDSETLTIFESGPDSGRFIGSIATVRASGASAQDDCVLSVIAGDAVTILLEGALLGGVQLGHSVNILADPFGTIFDSETGASVSGVQVTLRDAVTGLAAQVFAEDGVTPWPSSVISGSPITDGAGNVYPMMPGQYWFPLTFLGRYRLEVEPPAPYTAPSIASPAQLASLLRPDGQPFVLVPASYGEEFVLDGPLPVEIDIPVDRDNAAIALSKTVSRPRAQPGDALLYSMIATNTETGQARRDVLISVDLPRWLRIRPDTLRIDGEPVPAEALTLSADGLRLDILLGEMAGGASRRISYAATIRANAPPGQLVSNAAAFDALGRSSRANAAVVVERDMIASRMTIIGRVIFGDCGGGTNHTGLGGVRVMMEDGSFAVTDAEGRYHLEGVVPGTHVVQIARSTLPAGAKLVDCAASTRSAGSPASRFVIGQGGSLARADFHVVLAAPDGLPRVALADGLDVAELLTLGGADVAQVQASAASGARAATREADSSEALVEDAAAQQIDWLALGDGPDGWLAPAEEHNPRVPAIKVAFRHRQGQTIRLYVDGKPVDLTAFDTTLKSADGKFAVSLWRGVPLLNERTVLTAEIVNSQGGVNARLEREVFFVSQPARVVLVEEQSMLVADGMTRPVVVVRITDRNGRPVREGISGDFVLSAPFESAAQIDLQQIRQLSGIGEASARWMIEGDEGLARIELAPTMVSGALRIEFNFGNDNIRRRQEIEAWVVPGDIEWTIVGLGEASLGARTIADNMERGENFDSDLGRNARLALYAKGRILGKYLLTLAYDSAKQRDDQPLLGALDPTAYYTVFADNSQRRFDAATREKLYVRIETSTFFALYGDFQTGFDETTLGRYQRTATGIRTEARWGAVRAEAFGAKIGTNFRRDEFQGNGLAGPYPLGSRDIVINSERVTIEVRDRFRSEVIVSSRSLTRFIDYSIDVLSGTITFSEPIVSRDFDLNPQIVIIEYETNQVGSGAINAGLRMDWTSKDSAFRMGATALTDKGDAARTNIGVVDGRLGVGDNTELRAEAAISENDGLTGAAWLIEAQHQTGSLDLVGYARSIDGDYGTGQQSIAEGGRRKLGIDARYQVNDYLTAMLSASQDDNLADASQRRAGQGQIAYRSNATDLRLGIAHFNDRLANGDRNSSTLLEAGATQRGLDNRLELSAASSLALDKPESIDLPARHRLGLRYAVTRDVRITGTYEIADGATLEARTLRAGVEVSPWQGGRIVSSLEQHSTGSGAVGQSAGFGVAQTIAVTPRLNLNATLDGNRILGEAPGVENVINPGQPIANGGPLGLDGTLFEDFTAVTLSGTWRSGKWTATGRGEYRDGQFADRKGLTLGVIRQVGEGSSVGGNLIWTRSNAPGGTATAITDAVISIAHRPDGSALSILSRIEYRSDRVVGAVVGEVGPAGRTALTINGDAEARRLIGSVSANWTPRRKRGIGQVSEVGLFFGTRYSFDRLEDLGLAGFSALAGLDLRLGLSERFDIGGSANMRANLNDGSYDYTFGPQASFVVTDGALLSVGYNFEGMRDPDFSLDRALNQGLFAAIRFKFDADLLVGQSR